MDIQATLCQILFIFYLGIHVDGHTSIFFSFQHLLTVNKPHSNTFLGYLCIIMTSVVVVAAVFRQMQNRGKLRRFAEAYVANVPRALGYFGVGGWGLVLFWFCSGRAAPASATSKQAVPFDRPPTGLIATGALPFVIDKCPN